MSWKPEVSLDEAAHLLKELYGRTHQRLETLPGYDDAVRPVLCVRACVSVSARVRGMEEIPLTPFCVW